MIELNKIKKWKTYLDLNDWNVTTHEINDKQVLYDKDIPEEDKYFIGVQYYLETKKAIIYHARDLRDEDIVHELLHVKYPNWTEDQVNEETDNIMLDTFYYGDGICSNCDNMELYLDEQCPECGRTASDARADKAVAKIMSKPTLEDRQTEFMNQVSNILKF